MSVIDSSSYANSVGLWSAGDSKIVAPDSRVLALANNREETIMAGRKYARDAFRLPAFLQRHWQEMLAACRCQLRYGIKPRRRLDAASDSGQPRPAH